MRLLKWSDAAKHCRDMPLSVFRNAVKTGKGPAYFMPTSHKILFDSADLDEWMAKWERREMYSPQNSLNAKVG